MSQNPDAIIPSEREGRILELLRNSLDHKMNLVENESSSQSQILAQLKKELDEMIEFGTQALSQYEEKKIEEPVPEGKKPGMQIEVDSDGTPSSRGGQKVPASTKEKKTGLLDGKPNPADRRNSELGKSDKHPTGGSHPAEESKTNPPNKTDKKPGVGSTPKGNTKAEEKKVPEKPAPKNVVPPGKKPADVKKTEPAKDDKKEEKKEENTPEQAAIKESLSTFKSLNKQLITGVSDLLSTPTEPAVKIAEAVCVLLGEKTDLESQKKFFKGGDLVKRLTNLNSDSVSDESYYKAKELLKGQSETAKSKNGAVTASLKWANRVLKQIEVKRGLKVEETQPESEVPVNGEVKHEEKIESIPHVEEESKEGTPSTEGGAPSVKEGIISKEEIAGLKAKKNPPPPVGLVLDATCAALKLVPKQVGAKKTYDHDALLKIADLEAKINGFDITTVPKDVIKKIREFADKPDFKVEKVQSLPGAVSLCKWIQSIVEHDKANSPPEEAAPKDTKPPADKKETGKKPTPAAPVKKEEKKVEEKKPAEKKEEKKPATTPATNKGGKVPAKEEKKEASELTQLVNKINKAHVTEIGAMAKPVDTILQTMHVLSLLIENKEHNWDHYRKTYLKSQKDLTDKLNLDVHKIPKANIEAAQGAITSHKLTEEHAKKASLLIGQLFHYVQTAIKLAGHGENKEETQPVQAENKENESQASNTNPAAENKEEKAATEEPKQEEKIPDVAEVKHEEKPAEAQPEEKAVEAAPQEEKTEAPKQEETQPEVTQPEVTHANEVQAPVEEQANVEQHHEQKEEVNGTQENHETQPEAQPEPEKKEEEQKVEEPVQEKVEEPVAEPVVEPVANGEQHQETENAAAAASGNDEEIVKELNEILGEDVSSQIGEGGVREYVNQKARGIENQIAVFNAQNEEYRKDGVAEEPEKKPYEIKESTKGFIGMVEQAWVSELLHKPEWDEKISQIMTLFFLIQGYTDVPPLNNPEAIKAYASEKLKAHEENIVDYLMAVEKKLDLDIELKMRIQEFLQDKAAILTATTFDGVDGFCGMISFLLKEACEYLGVIPKENAKKVSAKEKIYLLNLEKIDYYNQKQTKVIEVAHKFGIPLDA